MHCYIAGPMRGHEQYNFPAFEEAEDRLMSEGWDVTSLHTMDLEIGFDPNGTLEGFDLNGCVRRDVEAIISVDALVLLPGWQDSIGARAEKALADWLGRPCFEYPEMTPLEAL